jgi:hypothetical protein
MTAKPAEKSTPEINRLIKAPCDPAYATLTDPAGAGTACLIAWENSSASDCRHKQRRKNEY